MKLVLLDLLFVSTFAAVSLVLFHSSSAWIHRAPEVSFTLVIAVMNSIYGRLACGTWQAGFWIAFAGIIGAAVGVLAALGVALLPIAQGSLGSTLPEAAWLITYVIFTLASVAWCRRRAPAVSRALSQ